MKQDQILQALSTLDPDNNDHWTQDGSPRLGAVGEGVTRQAILDVAPLFNRKNAQLPTPDVEPTDEEILAEIKRAAAEFEGRKKAADQAYKDALAAEQKAKEDLHKARLELAKLAAEEKAKDTRTDTQINMDYLKSEFDQRMKRALQQNQIFQHLQAHNLPTSGVDLAYISPADKAIAQRVIKERRERLRGNK